MSDGTTVESPRFLKTDLPSLQKKGRKLSMSKQNSHHREQNRKELNRLYERIVNKRNAWQWQLAHGLCRQYDRIFIEDLRLTGMMKLWGRKMSDLAHAGFVNKLEYVAGKCGVTVHKIDRFFPSSKTCTCGYGLGPTDFAGILYTSRVYFGLMYILRVLSVLIHRTYPQYSSAR